MSDRPPVEIVIDNGTPPEDEHRPHVSWSEIDTWRTCPYQHHVKYIQGLRPIDRQLPLEKGIAWHELMEARYSEDPVETPEDILGRWRQEDRPDDVVSLMEWMYEGYDRKYQDEEVRTVATELGFLVELPYVGGERYWLMGFIDLLVEIQGRLWLVDHKSGARKPNRRNLELADQWSLYGWALDRAGYKVFGSMHSYAKTERLKRAQTLDERFHQEWIDRSTREYYAVAQEVSVQAQHAKLNSGHHRTPGDHCFWRCQLAEYCIVSRRYGDTRGQRILNSTYQPKD